MAAAALDALHLERRLDRLERLDLVDAVGGEGTSGDEVGRARALHLHRQDDLGEDAALRLEGVAVALAGELQHDLRHLQAVGDLLRGGGVDELLHLVHLRRLDRAEELRVHAQRQQGADEIGLAPEAELDLVGVVAVVVEVAAVAELVLRVVDDLLQELVRAAGDQDDGVARLPDQLGADDPGLLDDEAGDAAHLVRDLDEALDAVRVDDHVVRSLWALWPLLRCAGIRPARY